MKSWRPVHLEIVKIDKKMKTSIFLLTEKINMNAFPIHRVLRAEMRLTIYRPLDIGKLLWKGSATIRTFCNQNIDFHIFWYAILFRSFIDFVDGILINIKIMFSY